MSEKEGDKQEEEKTKDFSYEDTTEKESSNSSNNNLFQSTNRHEDNHQPTTYNSLPSELEHLFGQPRDTPGSATSTTSNTSSPLNNSVMGTPIVGESPVPVSNPSTPNTTAAIPSTSNSNTSSSSGGPSSMTLLDNLTAQLSADRKEKFIELFRKLQTSAISANQFLAEARMLLDQQQYQQLENLKTKPAAKRPATIQPVIKRPMNTSQIRAEDTQRAMSGLIAPQAKRTRSNNDIPTTNNTPMYTTTATAATNNRQQQLLQQQMMHQHLMQQHQQQQLMQQHLSAQLPPQAPSAGAVAAVQAQQQQSQSPSESILPQESNVAIQDFMNPEMLHDVILKRADGLKIGADIVTLIGLATEERITKLIRHMIFASKHRVDSQTFTQPIADEKGGLPFKITDVQDIKKQLLAIERVEREEERKRKELILERERKAQMGEEGNEVEEETNNAGKPVKKKKKKDMGPGVTARYMSDDVRNKTTNETALMIAGGVMKSWMLSAGNNNNASAPAPAPSSAAAPIMKEKQAISRQNSCHLADLTLSPVTANTMEPIDDQPRGRGRPRRRKSGSGPDIISGIMNSKKTKGFATRDGGLFLPPSTIGRPNRLGEQGARKITVRDALFVLEDEYENNRENAPRTLHKAYSIFLK